MKHKRIIDRFYIVLGIRIQIRREKMCISQKELADKLNFNRSSISNIESGKQRIYADTLVLISKILKTTVLQLTKGI